MSTMSAIAVAMTRIVPVKVTGVSFQNRCRTAGHTSTISVDRFKAVAAVLKARYVMVPARLHRLAS
jgi:hypothetical protein